MPKYMMSPIPFSANNNKANDEELASPLPSPKLNHFDAIMTAMAARNEALYLRCLLRLESAQREEQMQPPYPRVAPLDAPTWPTSPVSIRRTQSSPDLLHAPEPSDDEALTV